MNQEHNSGQPQASFIPSDFNDLHLMFGLEAVKAQIDHAILNFIPLSPEPPNNNSSQNDGSNEKNSHVTLVVENPLAVDTGQGGSISTENVALPDDIQKFVKRYYLIETKTDIWDDYDKVVIKKNAFTALLGQKQYKLWLEHKNVISKADFDHNVNTATNLTIQELLDNFVVLANSEEAWNLQERRTWLIKHIRIAYPNIFDLWFKSPARKIIPRQNLIFDPKQMHDHDENYINIYRGLNIDVMRDQFGEQLSRPEVFEDCRGIITLINDLCDSEKVAVDFLLKWLAFPLQNIGAKMATCVLMHGHIHGSGKSLMFGTIMKKIYGEYHTTVGQAQLDNQYNEWIENKLFGVFEEIVDNKKKHNVMGMIKHLITGETLYVSKKFVSGWEMNNHLNTVFLSNNTQPLPIEEKDRRFLVLNPGKDLDGDLHERVMREIKTNGVQAFYTYLMGLDLSDFHEHVKPPMTRAKKTMIDYSRAGFDTFYHEWINGDTKFPYVSCKSEQLYKAFGQWSRTTGEHQISMKRFIIEGKKHGIIPSDKAKHWKGTRIAGQNKVIIIGEKPKEEQEQLWLGLQIEQFQDSLDGVNDVPEAKYI
nr:primase-helicase family protein [Acinetobacter junii]